MLLGEPSASTGWYLCKYVLPDPSRSALPTITLEWSQLRVPLACQSSVSGVSAPQLKFSPTSSHRPLVIITYFIQTEWGSGADRKRKHPLHFLLVRCETGCQRISLQLHPSFCPSVAVATGSFKPFCHLLAYLFTLVHGTAGFFWHQHQSQW